MKEYAALRSVSWIIRIAGALAVLGGVVAIVIAVLSGDTGMMTIAMAAAPAFFGLVMYAFGDALEALADIARNTARSAAANESVSQMTMNEISTRRAA